MQKIYQRGFTLIELLVVIAIIGILASIVLASLDSARKKGRDARRIADIKQIQLALELYYDAQSAYPPALTVANLVTPGYISVLPTDPSSSVTTVYNYSYAPLAASSGSAVCSSYHVGTSLETSGSTALTSDADTTSASATVADSAGLFLCSVTGASADFPGADTARCATGDPGVACYDVRP